MLIPLQPKEWISGDYREVARLRFSARDLEKRNQIHFIQDHEDGLGAVSLAGFKLPSGRQFVIVDRLEAPPRRVAGADIEVDFGHPHLTDDLEEALEALHASSRDLLEVHPEIRFKPYGLFVEGKKGEPILISKFACRADALLEQELRREKGFGHLFVAPI
jgi:hypothetical protein